MTAPVEEFCGVQYLTYCDATCAQRRARVDRGVLPWTDEHGAERLHLLGCGHTAIEYRESRTA